VWVFTRSGSTWSQQGTKLVGDCPNSCSGPNGTGETSPFGIFAGSIALSGDGNTALIGSFDQSREGAAWVFTMVSSPQISLAVSLAGVGSGSVKGPGISCPRTCAESLPAGSAVSLVATPRAGSTFAGWSGGCSGTGSCRLQLSSNTTVTATFKNLPSNRFTIARVHTYADGTITAALKVPGPGRVDVLATAWNDNLASIAKLLQPAPHRFVFARAHTSARRSTTLHVTLRPNAHGRRLVLDHTYPVTLRLWITYTPVRGRSRSVGFYGLHPAGLP
jgi:Divergent InlB B-repeat domain